MTDRMMKQTLINEKSRRFREIILSDFMRFFSTMNEYLNNGEKSLFCGMCVKMMKEKKGWC